MNSTMEETVAQDRDLGAPSVEAAIEALLIVADEPMPAVALASSIGVPVEDVEQALHALVAQYAEQGRGFELREVAGGWRYYTAMACAPLLERYAIEGQQARLTQAALETLAVIAYKQPVTRGRISAIRGVNVDGVIKTLLLRGLIEEVGHEAESNAILYRTTGYFLERMGLASLTDLPPIAEHLPDLADLEEVLDAVASGD
jgi:segregation and condensation protein B